jgi:hypothetical protein
MAAAALAPVSALQPPAVPGGLVVDGDAARAAVTTGSTLVVVVGAVFAARTCAATTLPSSCGAGSAPGESRPAVMATVVTITAAGRTIRVLIG